MKKYTHYVLAGCSLFLFSCLSSGNGQNSLPKDISSLDFNLGIIAIASVSDMVAPGTGTAGMLVLNKNAGIYSGTFTFSCKLNLTLTTSESSTLDGYLTNSKYCTYEKDVSAEDADYGKSCVTVNTTLPVIYRDKPSNGGKYFCVGGSDIYNYIKSILAAHPDISTCPTEWATLFN